MKILLVTQYFYPENFKSNDMAFELVKRGHEVSVLCGIPNYPEGVYYNGYGLLRKRTETIDGVKIYRCFQSARGRKAKGLFLSLNYPHLIQSRLPLYPFPGMLSPPPDGNSACFHKNPASNPRGISHIST